MISFNDEVKKRIKTFSWNVCLIALVAGLNAVSSNLEVLALPDWAVVLVGLAVSQLTKYLSNVKMGRVAGRGCPE